MKLISQWFTTNISVVPADWMPEKQDPHWSFGTFQVQNTWKDKFVRETTLPNRPTEYYWFCSVCGSLVGWIDPWSESSSEAQAEFKLDNYRRMLFYPGSRVERHHLEENCPQKHRDYQELH